MKIQNETIVTINLSTHEYDAFLLVDTILLQLQEEYRKSTKFEPVENGEIFQIEELSRIRGVLGTIADNRAFRLRN